MFSHKKYNRNIFELLKFISMDFFWLFGFWQESHWFSTSILKKLDIIYQYCYQLLMLLLGRISPGAITSHDPMVWALRKIWLSECLQFENHFFLIINQKVQYPSIYWYCIFSKHFAILKNYKIPFPNKSFKFTRYITNM